MGHFDRRSKALRKQFFLIADFTYVKDSDAVALGRCEVWKERDRSFWRDFENLSMAEGKWSRVDIQTRDLTSYP
jgi:hypothetical protein